MAGVAEEPVDADFEQAAIYRIDVPSEKDCCPSNTRETVPVFTQMASCWLIISTMAVSFVWAMALASGCQTVGITYSAYAGR